MQSIGLDFRTMHSNVLERSYVSDRLIVDWIAEVKTIMLLEQL